MEYNIAEFEKAALKKGFVIDSIKKSSPITVQSMFGSVISGTLVRPVRWDSNGRCYSLRGKPLSMYDLELEQKNQ